MSNSSNPIVDAFSTLIERSSVRDHDDLERHFRCAVDRLISKGIVHLGPDHNLGGNGLTVRSRLILERMGFSVKAGREDLEDLIVDVPKFAAPSIPLVLEVKSGKAPSPTREQLRQLDYWVFEVSGESNIRRRGIPTPKRRNMSYEWIGAIQPPLIHPSPHKGIFIYNGPLAVTFDKRSRPMLSPNEAQFACMRSFCVISFPCLLSWETACAKSSAIAKEFWTEVQNCMGELRYFDE